MSEFKVDRLFADEDFDVIDNQQDQQEENHNEAGGSMGEVDDTADREMFEEEIYRLDESVKCKSTKQSTKWAIKKFEDWLQKRNFNVDLESVSDDELAQILRKFYAEVRTNDGKIYSPGTLRGLREGIQRTIAGNPYNRAVNILTGTAFMLANRTQETMCKKWVGNGKQKHMPAF
ncbi:uncharacterized protein LOC127879223 [Dreissena polymorpha]|uniref:uncharacterized protein LOC127879223 n=1 Tax=Dreissena polymorpha TaxID=45954 RepID=UPI0022656108|nr:uncharacterized protein LOC127879223 [Dreissena polymorpha]